LECYVWLSFKYEKEFIERDLANIMKDRVSKIIESIIENTYFDIYKDIKKETIYSESEEDDDETSTKDNSNMKQNSILLTDNEVNGNF